MDKLKYFFQRTFKRSPTKFVGVGFRVVSRNVVGVGASVLSWKVEGVG